MGVKHPPIVHWTLEVKVIEEMGGFDLPALSPQQPSGKPRDNSDLNQAACNSRYVGPRWPEDF